ncbi:hypothetical protein FRB90_001873 [Tulasnella sp. 427]|nr:hypothetical protein FRB90_001873 [Tulasnella sp. 427]
MADTSPPATTTDASTTGRKRRRFSDGRMDKDLTTAALDNAIKTYESAELAVLHLMGQYDINWYQLKRLIDSRGLDVSFARVTWDQVAPLVGILACYGLSRVPTFDLERARIPNYVFKEIITVIGWNKLAYLSLRSHQNEEAHSRYLSPVFIRLTALFRSAVVATPETILESRIATQGRVEHQFCTMNGITLLLIEVKYKVGTPTDRLNAVAQVIAEADACSYRNEAHNYYDPVYCILFDGESFTFFKFDQLGEDQFCIGKYISKAEFKLADSTTEPEKFIRDLRPVCEVIFALMLKAHIGALYSQAEPDTKSRDAWLAAASVAKEVLNDCVQAGASLDKVAANAIAASAIERLGASIDTLPQGAAAEPEDLLGFYVDDF